MLIGDVNQTISRISAISATTPAMQTGFQDQMLYDIFMIFGVMVFTILAGGNIRTAWRN